MKNHNESVKHVIRNTNDMKWHYKRYDKDDKRYDIDDKRYDNDDKRYEFENKRYESFNKRNEPTTNDTIPHQVKTTADTY